ncbi:MAG: toxin-antitoxin system YwqK family antitoxin [Bacteroidia bacterium]
MKNSIIIFYLLLTTAITAQTSGENKIDAAGKKQGYWIKMDPKTGKKAYEGNFKNDKPQGVFKYYHVGMDSLRTRMDFRQDGKIAYATMYTMEGKLQAKGKYIDEKKDSTWTYYDDQGKLLTMENYTDGKKNGKSIVYYQNGNVSEERIYKMDVQDGPFKSYYDDKKVKAEGTYQNGILVGKNAFYFPSGTAAAIGNYDKGVKKGVWIYNKPDGKFDSREIWVNGKMLEGKALEDYLKKNKGTESLSGGEEFQKKNTGTRPADKPKSGTKKK